MKKSADQGPAHITSNYYQILEHLLEIQSPTTPFPVILGVERTVTLDADPRFT